MTKLLDCPSCRIETRWAVWNYKDKFFCGRFCWDTHGSDDETIPTFRTRDLAREAIRQMTSYNKESKPVKIQITMEML